jgi:hypothetical protein
MYKMKAFPTLADNGHSNTQDGMDLRDYFAAKAMQALLSDPQWRISFAMQDTAKSAYHAADIMIKERE